MSVIVQPAVNFDDVATLLGPKNPNANVCLCLSYRIGSVENNALRGPARADRVRELCQQDPPPGFVKAADTGSVFDGFPRVLMRKSF